MIESPQEYWDQHKEAHKKPGALAGRAGREDVDRSVALIQFFSNGSSLPVEWYDSLPAEEISGCLVHIHGL